jgi:ribose transport system permease protein
MGDLYVNCGANGFLAILAGLLATLLCGIINGLVVTRLRLASFIATLATTNIYRGIASVYTDGYSSQGMPPLVRFIGTAKIGIVPVSVLVMLLVYTASWFILAKTSFGLNMQAVGGNMNAAKLSGINIDKVRVAAFVFSGLTAFIAGMILAGRMNTTNPSLAAGIEMNCVAAAVIGGTSMHGGIGGVWSTMIGAVIMRVISNGMNQLGAILLL